MRKRESKIWLFIYYFGPLGGKKGTRISKRKFQEHIKEKVKA